MSTEIALPFSREVVDLASMATDALADRLDYFGDAARQIAEFRREVSNELAKRLDHEGVRSSQVGEWKISTNPPLEKDWDLDRLTTTLDEFVEKGVISNAKAQRCVRWKGTPVWNEIRNLLSDPRTAPEISLCFTEVPTVRSIRVEPVKKTGRAGDWPGSARRGED